MIAAFVLAMIAVVVSAGLVGAASVLRDLAAAVFFGCTLTLAIVLAASIYGAAVAT